MTGWGGQEGGGPVIGEGLFELYSSDEEQHISSSTSSLLGQLLGLVWAGGWRILGLVVSAVAQTEGLSLGRSAARLALVLLEEQLLLLLLVQMLLMLVLLLMLILEMLRLMGLLRHKLLLLIVLLML